MTAEQRVLYDIQFAKTVYTLLKMRFDGTPEERTIVAAQLLDDYWADTGGKPRENIVERLADYILGGDESCLSGSQLTRRETREQSSAELSD
jgi:hypothetical protein